MVKQDKKPKPEKEETRQKDSKKKSKKSVKQKIKHIVKSKPNEEIHTSVQSGVRIGVNDPETIQQEQDEITSEQQKKQPPGKIIQSPEKYYPTKRNKLGEPEADYDSKTKSITSSLSSPDQYAKREKPKALKN